MRTNKNITFNALNSYFLDTSNNTINKSWLEHHLDVTIMNTRNIYDKLASKRNKTRSIVWCGLIELANACIKEIEYPYNQDCYASSEQLKKWLDEYGNGYDTLADIIDQVEQYRQEECF